MGTKRILTGPRFVTGYPFPLDSLSVKPLFGWSLRRLSAAYNGYSCRITRLSDNASIDVGFVGNDWDSATALAFCAGTDGFITICYDQSGNNNNSIVQQFNGASITQGSLKIISGGSLFTWGGKPAGIMLGPAGLFYATTGGVTEPAQPMSFFAVTGAPGNIASSGNQSLFAPLGFFGKSAVQLEFVPYVSGQLTVPGLSLNFQDGQLPTGITTVAPLTLGAGIFAGGRWGGNNYTVYAGGLVNSGNFDFTTFNVNTNYVSGGSVLGSSYGQFMFNYFSESFWFPGVYLSDSDVNVLKISAQTYFNVL